MKTVPFLISLSVAACQSPEKPVTRDTLVDFYTHTPPRESPIHFLRRKLFPDPTDRAFALEARAPVVVEYSSGGEFQIEKPAGPDLWASPATSQAVFDSQKDKSMVVIIVAKNLWSDEEQARHLTFLNDWFAARGYRRIVIQQARAWGRPTHSDMTLRDGKPIRFQSTPGIRRGLHPLSN